MSPPGFHRRPLPPGLIDFRAPEGRRLLREALDAGTAEAFFPLIAHLHTQGDPAWCGLGSLVTVLNALEVDPGRTWKGPWRWFGEEQLTCCKSLDRTAAEGLSLPELGCLARCNGATAEVVHAEPGGEAAFREALRRSVERPAGPFLVAGYDRAALGQTGAGHYSPLGAWHEASDRVLVLDVARFKYPPHWVPADALWAAMLGLDPSSGQPRGWLRLARAEVPEVDPAQAIELARRLEACPAPLSTPQPGADPQPGAGPTPSETRP